MMTSISKRGGYVVLLNPQVFLFSCWKESFDVAYCTDVSTW